MSIISCYRVRFKLPLDNATYILSVIEDIIPPDAIAIGELAEGKEAPKGLESIELLYQDCPDQAILQNIFLQNNVVPTDYVMDSIGNEDWVTASLRELPAVTAGRFIIHGSHIIVPKNSGYHALEIDAGLAFGTGHHETTAGCLEAMTYLSKFFNPQNIIDIGTGTGVLAMGAFKLWRRKNIIATDIDNIAVRVTKNNIGKNDLSPYISAYTASGTTHPKIQKNAPYNLVIANILARPLMGLAVDFANITADNGYVILSGLLWRQVKMVSNIYIKQGFILHKALRFGQWGTLILHKKCVK